MKRKRLRMMESPVQGQLARRVRWGGCGNVHSERDATRRVLTQSLQERRDAYTMKVKQSPHYYDLEWRKQATKDYAISRYDQQNELPAMKQTREEYQDIGSHVLQNVCHRVERAFQGFFDRIKKGKTAGYPRFQGCNRYDSFCYPDQAGWKLDGSTLHLSKIGDIQVKLHRPMEGKIKTCTIKREGEHWYVTFACEVEAEQLPLSYEDVGIDLGVTHFAALSDGTFIDNPRHYRKGEKRLEKRHQSLARKKRGSHRRKKAVKLIAQTHRKVRNQRKDFLHKESRKLVNQYQVIVFEDLQTGDCLVTCFT